ncbi:integrase (plasmid) [Burkholderia sp. JP2-270]|uniref:tyrosine-type recombinase/integrase n=1 Tax=Burkholderia sp. JP2-270 TaxID=2217913 RepID=UPI000DA3F1AB|nr:tyrosine-type recombinase/integrase [Burkholderia sp. JP2-270]AWV05614.1 integrase [Burkholderia sp. JP2-270]
MSNTSTSTLGAPQEHSGILVVPVSSIRAPCALRAFELLAAQPISLVGIPPAERDAIVVTAVADAAGHEHPVSRFGDRIWDLASVVEAKNRKASALKIVWPDDVPNALVDDAKAALYCAQRRGPRGRKWSGSSMAEIGRMGVLVLRHLAQLGLSDFSQVRALHLSDHIADLRRTLKPMSVHTRLQIVNLVWSFNMEVLHPLLEHPWAGLALWDACGGNEDHRGPSGRTGMTPVIPRSVQRILFSHCEASLAHAESLFRARDAGVIGAPNRAALTAIRDAVLYLLQVSSGMRNSESTGVTSGCWRTEQRNGVTYHWVRTREIKTTGGRDVDFLVPPEAIHALEILQRYAEPLQARLADEARWLEDLLAQAPDLTGRLGNGMRIAEAAHRLNHVRGIGRHLVLGLNVKASDHLATGARVEVLSSASCAYQLKQLAVAAGTEWDLANHQCRRTFAYNVANSRLGRMGLVFLKWQLKHASMSWTQLYAASPYQDHALYREFEEEMFEARLGLLEGWAHPDALLSGGAGKKILQTRARAARDIKQLLRQTAESVELRSTGHAWCISGTHGCHGQGVYDPSMCGGCSQAVIDQGQASAWQMIHLDNLRLAAITDCGPVVADKAGRAVERSKQVLQDLGCALPTDDQAQVYTATLEGT